MEFKTSYEIAKLRLQNALHQSDQARFALDRARTISTKQRSPRPSTAR
jgi:hypothetical protein